jgi:hypothetical protein
MHMHTHIAWCRPNLIFLNADAWSVLKRVHKGEVHAHILTLGTPHLSISICRVDAERK